MIVSTRPPEKSFHPKVLSVIIPAYNEIDSIAFLIARVTEVLPSVPKELVIVDDGSKDGTREWLRETLEPLDAPIALATVSESDGTFQMTPHAEDDTGRAPVTFQIVFHEANKGKGGAVRTGLETATGDAMVIQDADLEYDPVDWKDMWNLIAERRVADVVFGSRFYGRPHRTLYFYHYLANKLITFLFNLFYDQQVTDVEVCYKMFTRPVWETLALTSNDFGFEIEFSAQVARARHWRIYEVGIMYFGRTYAEGKKITWKDGVKALWYLVKFRFQKLPKRTA
ncbi:MAG: glycosyltransferase family 2 protein [Rhodospirillaceae bacterium]